MSQPQVVGRVLPIIIGGIEVVVIPLGPAVVAVLTALLVRLIIMTKSKPGRGLFEALVTLLAMLLSLVSCDGRPEMTALTGAAIGLGYGALGVGIIEVGKSKLGTVLGEGLKFVLRSMLDSKPPQP